ncbi:MAG TPA: hypothetical protein PLR99_30395 [Polyangiaceae bacterium]|nr:hypothetical protein [Polyangiaceae bacterium]
MRNVVALALVVLGGSFALACGDAGENTSGYYRKGTYEPGPGDAPAATPGASNGGSTAAGGGTTPPGDPTPPSQPTGAGKVDITLDNASPTLELMAESKLTVNVAPKEGFTGKVDLAVTGAPAGMMATFDKTSLELTTASASAMLTVKTSSEVAPGAVTLTVTATSASGPRTTPVNVTVSPTLTLSIPPNAGALTGMAANTAFAPAPINLKLGGKKIAVKIKNNDSMGHIIHAGNTGGFNHGNRNAPIAPGAFEGNVENGQAREVNAAGTYSFYLHDKTRDNANGSIVAQ